MKIAVNLLNYFSAPMGGDESFVKNLIKGFNIYKPEDMQFVYLISKPAFPKFKKLLKKEKVKVFNTGHDRIRLRLIWQNIKLKKIIPNQVDILFTPQFKLPRKINNTKTVSVFHDCQYKDLPENFTFLERRYFDYINYITIKNSDFIVSISEFTKEKINQYYNLDIPLQVIHNPIKIKKNISKKTEKEILKKYNLKKEEYYYTLSANYKHKNLITLVKLFSNKIDDKLIITGPLRDRSSLLKIKNDKNIKLTGYISEIDKNVLLKNCKLFLFPSVYEGFGMPIIEALLHGKKVITTRKASIPEVSLNKAQYVNDPYNLNEWYNKILETEKNGLKISPKTQKLFSKKYSIKTISNRYLNLFKKIE